MTIGQKASISTLISVILFAGFAVLAYSGLFETVQTRFYNPRVASGVNKTLENLARESETYHSVLSGRFKSILALDFVRRSVLPNQSSEDIFNRSSAFGRLAQETPGLLGVRLVDVDGRRIHFSTYEGDVLRREEFRQVYRNYGDGDVPLEVLGVPDGDPGAVRILEAANSFVYVFPFRDSFDAYRGTALFQVARSGLQEYLVKVGALPVGEDFLLLDGRGLLFGAPRQGRPELVGRVVELWSGRLDSEPIPVGSMESSEELVLFSRRGETGL